MQQATSLTGDLAPTSGNVLPAGNPQASFVINLCASTTPVGLVHPSHPQLKRFTFFVSRRREEGRERFRLHMGYFSSQEEAEKLLDAVRDIYPAAWAGVAPGQNLRSRTPTAPASDVAARAPLQASAAAARPPAPAATMSAATAAATTAPAAATAAATVAAAPAAAPAVAAALPATASVARAEETATHSLSNVRAAIDSLRDEPTAPAAPRPTTAVPPAPATTAEPQALQGAQVLSLLEDAPATRAAAAVPTAPAKAVSARAEPSKPAAAPTPLRAVPQLRAVPAARPANPVTAAPPRAATSAATPAATPAAAPRAPAATSAAPPELAAYAVQLLWSVQPIDMSQVPQLAIFAAYKLYGAEGNRDGRRWYGLRLGFFTDAVSAKQVAQYVRSEFKSVSVVPVTQRERERASAATARPLPATTASKSTGHELNFIEEIPTDTAMSGSRPALQVQPDGAPVRPRDTAAAAGMPSIDALISELAHNERAGSARAPARAPSSRAPTGKRAKLRVAQGTKPVSKRPQHDGPLTLEETLEILGASTLQLDNGRGELLNDAANGNRQSSAGKSQRGSRFGRLIDRLADRFSGS